jgi:hypothetical protein
MVRCYRDRRAECATNRATGAGHCDEIERVTLADGVYRFRVPMDAFGQGSGIRW